MARHYDIDEDKELLLKELDLHTIHPINIKDTKQGAKYILIGAPGTGKSTLIKDIMYFKKHIIPIGHVFSGTDDSNKFFTDFFPDSFIFTEEQLSSYMGKKEHESLLEENPVVKFKRRQQLASTYLEPRNIVPWALEIFDDCTSDTRYLKRPPIQAIYKNGRHWRMLHLASYQFCLDMPTNIRTNVNGVFIMKEGNPKMRDRLFVNYSDGGMDRYEFDYIMDQLTEDYCAMYINKRAKSNRVDETILYYKSDPKRIPIDWKFGCKDFWRFHNDRYFNTNK